MDTGSAHRIAQAQAARAILRPTLSSFLEAPLFSSFRIRMITTGHFTQRVFLRQHFFLGLSCETLLGLTFPMWHCVFPSTAMAENRTADKVSVTLKALNCQQKIYLLQ